MHNYLSRNIFDKRINALPKYAGEHFDKYQQKQFVKLRYFNDLWKQDLPKEIFLARMHA